MIVSIIENDMIVPQIWHMYYTNGQGMNERGFSEAFGFVSSSNKFAISYYNGIHSAVLENKFKRQL